MPRAARVGTRGAGTDLGGQSVGRRLCFSIKARARRATGRVMLKHNLRLLRPERCTRWEKRRPPAVTSPLWLPGVCRRWASARFRGLILLQRLREGAFLDGHGLHLNGLVEIALLKVGPRQRVEESGSPRAWRFGPPSGPDPGPSPDPGSADRACRASSRRDS